MSGIKKAFIPLIAFAVSFSFLFSGCGSPQRSSTATSAIKTGTQLETLQTAAATTAENTSGTAGPVIPEIITYYELNKTYKVDEYFTAGFVVKLPKIVSIKPEALKINSDIDKMRVVIDKEYNSVSNIKDYRTQYNYSYETFIKGNVVFLSVFSATGWWASEYVNSNEYYAYDYIADKRLQKSEISAIFGMDEEQVIKKIESKLKERNLSFSGNTDDFELYVNANGKLIADISVDSGLGEEYSEIVELA